jgi:putative heme-binding domain-containing protein
MKRSGWNAVAAGGFVLFVTAALSVPSAAQDAAARKPPATPGIVEVVPTSRRRPVAWRYTFEKPAENWAALSFDDESWKTGDGAFGTAGTPGIAVNTRWATSDVWLRRKVDLPATGMDVAALQLFLFHDEDVEVYFDGVLAARQSGFIRDYEPVDILPAARKVLAPGAKFVLAVHCRQTTGGQGVDVGLATVSAEFLAARRKNEYRAFASSHPGDAANGRKLFLEEQRVGCSRCHTTDGFAGRAGPDLAAAGDKFPRAELADAILNPSAQIAVGYSTTVVTTKTGDAIVGVLKEAADDHLGLMTADGKLQRVAVADVKSRRTANESLMPEGLESALSREEFADLVGYLVSLRLPGLADAGRQGMPAEIPQLRSPVRLVPVHANADRFNHPCWFGQVPGQAGSFLVCEHETGRVWLLSTSQGGAAKTLWGDFHNEVRPGGATGLLGLAFHPDFRNNRRYFIQHEVLEGGQLYARVSEKTAAPDLRRDSGTPSRTVIQFACATDVHSGGGIDFGPDGMLYIGMGDTGPQGDPQGHGQDLKLPLGKMLRIDVDRHEADKPYAIPADNPFRSRDGVRPEIWAYGFREPWRFSFDPATGDLWVGDVGQDRIEEVDIVRRGENMGWNVYEGFDLFSNRYRPQGTVTFTPPVFAYTRRLGNSITGGYVYHGERAASGGGSRSPFDGLYVCGDYNSKRVWGLRQSERKLTGAWQLCTSPQSIASFGRDEAGALYLVGYEGTIYRLDFGAASAEPKGR